MADQTAGGDFESSAGISCGYQSERSARQFRSLARVTNRQKDFQKVQRLTCNICVSCLELLSGHGGMRMFSVSSVWGIVQRAQVCLETGPRGKGLHQEQSVVLTLNSRGSTDGGTAGGGTGWLCHLVTHPWAVGWQWG